MTKLMYEDSFYPDFKKFIDCPFSYITVSMDDKELLEKVKKWLKFNMLEYNKKVYSNLLTKDFFFPKDTSKFENLFNQVASVTKTYPINNILMFIKISDYFLSNLNFYESNDLIIIPVDKNKSKIKIIKKTSKSKSE